MDSKKPMTLGRKWVLDIAALFGALLVATVLKELMHEIGLIGFWPAFIRTVLVLFPLMSFLGRTNTQYNHYKKTLKNQSVVSELSGEASPTSK